MDYKLPSLPKRDENSNKGTFGKVLNIAGSEYMPGAAYLSSISALKIGAGYVQLLSNKSVLNIVATHAPEIVLSDSVKNINFREYSVVSFGCGCGVSEETKDKLFILYDKRDNIPTIIDADGLNMLSEYNFEFDKNTVLTPHPKEASRLLGCDITDILKNPIKSAKDISKKYNCITVLKSHNTIVTDGNILYKNSTGCSALAKAGSGDVLCGMIAGLIAQNMDIFDAAALGVYLHGLTGDIAAENLSEYGVLASDLLRYIPFAIKIIQ